ncbi:Sodium/hydrogen exchanger family-domain-containing protein [Globomyces pollinis-pini]|nr:Sodium/hydrogen exchanger family-domain-containing protein [Globomyces pollinis-pini]KAJ2991794.1 Sodium/hydrogen exchanger 8 [Globomyces sp. JEL0801]
MGGHTDHPATTSTTPVFSNGTVPAHAEHSEHDTFVAALLLLMMITLAMNLAHYLKHKEFKYLGETAVYILFGLSVSAVWTSISYDPTNKAIQLDSHFFALVLLPPIIFEGGFSIQRSMFFQNIVPILGLAMFGGFYSTFVISILMYFFSRLITDNGWSIIESLVFGALISSTDPVSVLSLLPADVDKRLYMFIFGESALNDAVAIILFRFFTSLQSEADNLSPLPFLMSFLQSCVVFVGSFAVGIIMSLCFAKITKHVWITGYEGAIYEMVMLFVFAYGSYLLAEILALTGIISIFFCGMGMGHYAHPNLTELTKKTVKVTLRVICMLSEGFIFLYFGLGLLSFGVEYNMLFVVSAIIAIFAGRTHVFIVCSLTKFLPGSRPVPINQQTLMWFSGLRGAVAFALAVTFLDHPDFGSAIKGAIFGTTVMVILFTVLGLGGLTPYMLTWLEITEKKEEPTRHNTLPSHEKQHDVQPEADVDQSITENDLAQPVVGWMYRFDAKYIRPFFTHETTKIAKIRDVIERHESRTSRTNSRTGSLFNMSMHRASAAHREYGITSDRGMSVVQSPGVYSKVETGNGEHGTDQDVLIEKSNPADNLEAVNLN